jgi:hypothetical protein
MWFATVSIDASMMVPEYPPRHSPMFATRLIEARKTAVDASMFDDIPR